MNRFTRFFVFALAFAAAAHAQSAYSATKATSLLAAAEVITVQANAAANVRLSRTILFKSFDVTCSVACTVTLERDGTAATATTLTPVQLNIESLPPIALAFSSSDVGVGTVLAQYSLTAGGTLAVSLDGKTLQGGGRNLTVRTSAITGDVKINVQWSER